MLRELRVDFQSGNQPEDVKVESVSCPFNKGWLQSRTKGQ
jgi:hypothetical protein